MAGEDAGWRGWSKAANLGELLYVEFPKSYLYRVPQKKCLIAKFGFWVPIETVCS